MQNDGIYRPSVPADKARAVNGYAYNYACYSNRAASLKHSDSVTIGRRDGSRQRLPSSFEKHTRTTAV